MRTLITTVSGTCRTAARMAAVLVALVAVAIDLRAQELVHTFIAAPWVNGVDQVAWTDFDGNGAADLIVAYHASPLPTGGSDRVGVVLNPMQNPSALAAGPAVVFDTSVFPPPYGVVRHIIGGDFDGDGFADILIEAVPLSATGQLTNGIIFRLSALGAVGGFQTTPTPVYNGVVCSDFKAGDFNGDGILDSVEVGSTNGSQNFERVFMGGPIAPWPIYQTSSWNVTAPAIVADMNGDGVDDLAYHELNQVGAITAFLSGAGPALGSPIQSSIGTNFTNTAEFHVADVTGDGVPDVVNHAGSAATIYPGSATAFLLPALPQTVSGMGTAFATTDGDGAIDFLSVFGVPAVGAFEVRMARNQGGGAFSAPIILAPISAVGATFIGLKAADADGDGDEDVLVFRRQGFGSGVDFFENRALYGAGCPGLYGVPAISVGSAYLGNPAFGIGVQNTNPGTLAVLILSTTALAPSTCGFLIDTSPNALLLPSGQVIAGLTSAVGDGLWTTPLPNIAALSGIAIAAQWAILDGFASFSWGNLQLALSPARIIRFS